MTLSRRDFIKLVGGAAGMLALNPFSRVFPLPDFPQSPRLGRNCTGGKITLHTQPQGNAPVIKELYEDTVVAWLREVTGYIEGQFNQRWVETPEGFIHAAGLQSVEYHPNEPLSEMPAGKAGFWAEVTVPYVDFVLENPVPGSPWLKDAVQWNRPTRLYYSQVMWIDQIKISEVTGNLIYRINELYGSYGDIFWAEAAAFRPLTAEEVAPLSPEIDPAEKKVVANLTYQTLSCFEAGREVFFCQMSSGAKWDANGNAVDVWSTPIGEHWTWRKSMSIHMAGGTVSGGYDTPGVSWTSLFSGTGVAIHSTFWHNLYGTPRSHGCINVRPEDAKWIFRWTTPVVSLDPGDLTIQGDGGTHVVVEERTF